MRRLVALAVLTLVGGWRPGVERVEVTLQIDVLWFEPGADLVIRNVVVR